MTGLGMPIPGNIGKCGDLFVNIQVNITPLERNLFTTKGVEALEPIFKDKVRKTECPEESVQTALYLHKN